MDKTPTPPIISNDQDKSDDKASGKGKGSHGCNNNNNNNRLDDELVKLRREMPFCFIENQVGLRQLDVSLMSQLNSLKQSISEYKKALNLIVNGDDVDNNGDGQFNGQYDSSLLSMDQENDLPDECDEIDGEEDIITSDDEREQYCGEENGERSSSSESTV